MTANTNPLPLLPPPPPPQPPTRSPVPLIGHLPPECRPKVDSLMHLMTNIDNDVYFDQDERQRLRNSDVGKELINILQNCNGPRAKMLASMKLLQDESSDKEDERMHERNFLQFQTCLLRTSCPSRMKNFEKCWSSVSRGLLKQNKREAAVSRRTCQSERQALERCAGNLVSRSVREAVEESLDNEDF